MTGRATADPRLDMLVDAGLSLAAEQELDVLLQKIADLARDVIGASYAAVSVLGPNGGLVRFLYSGIDETTAGRIGHLPVGTGVLGAIIDQGAPLRLARIADHPRSSGFPDHHPLMNTFLGVPIVVRGNTFGRLYVTEKTGEREFDEDDERIMMTLAAQAGVAIENARLIEAMHDFAVLEERERISKELHDGIIQTVYSVGLSLQSAIGMFAADAERATKRINDAIAQLDDVVRDVRNYIFELRPAAVRERGLAAAIGELAEGVRANTLARVDLRVDDDVLAGLSEDQERHLIQVVREILSNLERHSHPTAIVVAAIRSRAELVIDITDDGSTFDPDVSTGGNGLRNMRERSLELGGSIEIAPRLLGGMIHRLRVPVVAGRARERTVE